MKNRNRVKLALALSGCMLITLSCSLSDLFDVLKEAEIPPTKSRMEGIWQVTEAYDGQDSSILNKISFPITAFHLSSDNSITSTAAPMFMNIVYGSSKYTEIAAKVDGVFNYANLDLTGGEWFIGGGPVDRFTIEMKLQGLPGQKAITDLLGLLGIGNDYLDVVIYHKFINVRVNFDSNVDSVMTWEFDAETTAEYNTKDNQGNKVLWQGWPVSKFSHCRFVLTKRVKDLRDLITDAKK